jgi:hypothetical protein
VVARRRRARRIVRAADADAFEKPTAHTERMAATAVESGARRSGSSIRKDPGDATSSTRRSRFLSGALTHRTLTR